MRGVLLNQCLHSCSTNLFPTLLYVYIEHRSVTRCYETCHNFRIAVEQQLHPFKWMPAYLLAFSNKACPCRKIWIHIFMKMVTKCSIGNTSSLLLKYSLFFKYSCTNIFHSRSLFTFYLVRKVTCSSFTKEVNQRLVERTLVFNGRLANR